MAESESTVIPVIEEEMTVSKRLVDRGGVRITKLVHEHEEIIDEQLQQERVTVERVPINQPVDRAPTVRQDDNTLIIPILEEILVVKKQLILKEEVRVTTHRVNYRYPQSTTVRREEAVIERMEPTNKEEN